MICWWMLEPLKEVGLIWEAEVGCKSAVERTAVSSAEADTTLHYSSLVEAEADARPRYLSEEVVVR